MNAKTLASKLTTRVPSFDAVGKTMSFFPEEEGAMFVDFKIANVKIDGPWITVSDKDGEYELRISDHPTDPMIVLYCVSLDRVRKYEGGNAFIS